MFSVLGDCQLARNYYFCAQMQNPTLMKKTLSAVFVCVLGLACVLLTAVPTQARDKNTPKKVYAFGYAEALNDTVIYITPIQELINAELDNKGFIHFRESYDAQLQQYLLGVQKGHTMCITIYGTSRSKLEKKFVRLRRDLNHRKHVRLVELTPSEFQFRNLQTVSQ